METDQSHCCVIALECGGKWKKSLAYIKLSFETNLVNCVGLLMIVFIALANFLAYAN